MSSSACCKGESTPCVKNEDGTCTYTKKCTLQTAEGPVECECRCRCECKSSNCDNCVCNCQCTPETAQKIETAEGVKYRCECTCQC